MIEEQYDYMIFGKCVYELLETYTILMIPLLNPDGYMISLYGIKSLKDLDPKRKDKEKGHNYSQWKYNGRGVDINRNFPVIHGSQRILKIMRASENETKTLIQIFHHYRIRGFRFSFTGVSIYYHRKV